MIQADGTVEFDSPRTSISPTTTRDDFLASPLFAISEPLNQNPPWSCYAFKPVAARGELFTCHISFCAGAVDSLSLSAMRPEFGTSWSDVTPEKEQDMHCFHKRMLLELFGRPPDKRISRGPDERDADFGYDFSWGEVWAITDIKSGDCEIHIRYLPLQR
jgi:hypothetical protein